MNNMGMNYYAVKRKPSLYNEPLHIGKSSAGWKFCFQGYQKVEQNWNEPDLTIQSVEDWRTYLKENDVVILNEEDTEVSYNEFFDLVETKQENNNPDNFKYCANINGYRFTFNDFA